MESMSQRRMINETLSHLKLAVFDIEGVLLPKNRYLTFELARARLQAGRRSIFLKFFKYLLVGFLYEARLFSLESALKRAFKLFQGITIGELLQIFNQVPLMPYGELVFSKLRERGIRIALISSGLPQVVVDDLASRLKADYAFGLELDVKAGVLTGNIGGEVIKENGKFIIMQKLLKSLDLTPKDCIIVADDRNNSSIFYPEALKIGFNPDASMVLKSDYVIKDSLMEILPIIEQKPRKPIYRISQNEAIRELIYASGFFVALAAIYFGTPLTIFLLSATAILYTGAELARVERRKIPLISSITLNAATVSEQHEFTVTPIFLALGITLSLLLFPSQVAYASIAVISLGDSAASIFGKFFGKISIPFNKGKNLEGSISGFAFAFLGASYFLSTPLALIGAAIGMVVETLPLPVNDNLSVPLVTGTLLTILL